MKSGCAVLPHAAVRYSREARSNRVDGNWSSSRRASRRVAAASPRLPPSPTAAMVARLMLPRYCRCCAAGGGACAAARHRSEEHTSELQSLMRISYAVFCLKKKKKNKQNKLLNKTPNTQQ